MIPLPETCAEYQYLFNSYYGPVWRNDSRDWNGSKPIETRMLYTADQMRAYGDAVRADERERIIAIIESHQVPVGNSAAGEMAADWTMDALREIRDAIRSTPKD